MIGKMLGHYQITGKLGEGGISVDYCARAEHLRLEVTIKVLPAQTLTDEAARQRFGKEATPLLKLSHAKIRLVHDFDRHDGIDFLGIKYISGVTVSGMLTSGPLPVSAIASLGTQLVESLPVAHWQGVRHRDLRPANLRFTLVGHLSLIAILCEPVIHCVQS